MSLSKGTLLLLVSDNIHLKPSSNKNAHLNRKGIIITVREIIYSTVAISAYIHMYTALESEDSSRTMMYDREAVTRVCYSLLEWMRVQTCYMVVHRVCPISPFLFYSISSYVHTRRCLSSLVYPCSSLM